MTAIRITARPAAGFGRCGAFHPPAPAVHPAGTFTADQIARLRAEPNLVVEEIAATAAASEPPAIESPPSEEGTGAEGPDGTSAPGAGRRGKAGS